MNKITGINFFRVGVVTIAMFFCSVTTVSAATLSLSPASGSYSTGDTIPVQIVVSSPNEPVNAVSGVLTFPVDKFQIVSLSKSSSVVNFWPTEPTFSNSSGKVNFEGVILSPTFQANRGVVLTLNLKAKSVGNASLAFPSASILANDGQGTDVTKGLSGATYFISLAKVEPKPVESKQVATSTVSEVTPVAVVSPSTLQPAEILLGTKYGAPAIVGASIYGKAQVLLTFVASNGTKVFITGTTDENGSFIILVPNTLKHGVYTVTAVLIKDDGTHSVASNEITITIGNIFSDIGWWVWLVFALLVALVVYLLLRVFFHVKKFQQTRASNKREVQDAEKVLYDTFNLLRKDILDNQSPTTLEKEVDSAEKVIDDKIKDLES